MKLIWYCVQWWYLEVAPLNLPVLLLDSQFICGMDVRKTGTKEVDGTGSEMWPTASSDIGRVKALGYATRV